MPAECSLLSSIQSIREPTDEGRLRKLYWIDTRDMLPDGLTKGSIDREALLSVVSTNNWKQVGDKPCELSGFVSASHSSAKDDISLKALDWLTFVVSENGVWTRADPDLRGREAVFHPNDSRLFEVLPTTHCVVHFD